MDDEFDDLFGASSDSDEEEVVAPKKLTKKKKPKSTGMAALLENDSGDDSDDSAFDDAAGDGGSSDEGARRKVSRKRARPAAKRAKRKPRAAATAAASEIDAAAAAAKKKKKKNDGSAYGVEEDAVRTKDDDAFIASDDDDTGMMEEYNKQQQNFVDAPDAEFDRPDREEDAERGYRERTVVDLARDAIRARKGVKKKKVDERRQKEDDAQKAARLLEKMLRAAADDRASFKAKRPGLEKAKLVGTVTAMLKDPNLNAALLDQNVLGVLAGAADQAGWLDVMPSGKLPALSLRTQLLAEIVKLPITQKHMAECNFGAVRRAAAALAHATAFARRASSSRCAAAACVRAHALPRTSFPSLAPDAPTRTGARQAIEAWGRDPGEQEAGADDH